MRLGRLIDELGSYGADLDVFFTFCGCGPDGTVHSYRGNYMNLAIGWKAPDGKRMSVGELRDVLRGVRDKKLTGWKGGEFDMHSDVEVYVDNAGCATGTMVSGVEEFCGAVFIITEAD